ncbi:MAG: tetratricopeptide repeat protein [Bdellovibrionaceae bacterium]|nr:tetratricopeptide repeat protein [Pseudobdellovibrionaceae bacterium]
MRNRVFILLGLLWGLGACSPPEIKDYEQAKSEAGMGHYRSALSSYDRVLKRAPESDSALKSAREASRIAILEVKEYRRAADYLQFLVLHSKDSKERTASQKQLASLYFDQLQNYDRAIIEFNKLLNDTESDTEKAQFKLDIARANYYQNNFFQAQSEIDEVLKLHVGENEKFAALVLKSNIYIARKEYPKAIETLKKVMETYPAKATQENVPQTMAVCYEESGNFLEAIKSLELARDKHSQPEYIDLRIKRLRERAKNQPGAKGLRK